MMICHATQNEQSPPRGGHTFHIPVMGTCFTIDTPLKVGRYGISSVVSIIDDALVEQVRKFYCEKEGEPYQPITDREEDSRARRITAYLNLQKRILERQVQHLQASPFESGSEITRYYTLLPEGSLKSLYRKMLQSTCVEEKLNLQQQLRGLAVPGCIDVNIMTKVDRENFRAGQKLPPEFNDALAALRGYASSDLNSSIVFSAGLNQRLYSYITQFRDFYPNLEGALRKKIIIKVSDYRSAEIQGKYLAKKGLWVSEYRIESGLNCGGHAFATKGYLLGPILEEFKNRRAQLREDLHVVYSKALKSQAYQPFDYPQDQRITVQGGIGTADEDAFLLKYYEVDGTGWGTPFLLVPEVSNVDPEHLRKLCEAGEEDVYLSDSSPLGVPFWNLRKSASEIEREKQVDSGTPGSTCPKRYLVSNTEFTEEPICLAAQVYQKKKLKKIDEDESLDEEQTSWLKQYVLGKSCLCRDLSGAIERILGINAKATPALCCGPNIVNFSKVATLEEMVGHIYGRLSLITNPDRPNMFIKELRIYIDYLRKEVEKHLIGLSVYAPNYLQEFQDALQSGIEYYNTLVGKLDESERSAFLAKLKALAEELEWVPLPELVPTA